MRYEDIIKQLAINENVSVEKIEEEMEKALSFTDLNCTAKEFIEITSTIIINKDYI